MKMKDQRGGPKMGTTRMMVLILTIAVNLSWTAEPTEEELSARLSELRQQKKEFQVRLVSVEQKLESTDSLIIQEANRFKMNQKRQKVDLERRKSELLELDGRRNELKGKIGKQKSEQSKIQNRIANQKRKLEARRLNLAIKCAEAEKLIDISLPWDREQRLERLRALRRDLEAGKSSVEEGFTRLSSLLREEVRFGDEVALLKKPITRNDGEVVNAQILRFGGMWMIYHDEEKKRYGVLVREEKGDSLTYRWREDLDFTERELVRTAIEVKGAKRPPQVVRLPLTLMVHQASEPQAKGDQ